MQAREICLLTENQFGNLIEASLNLPPCWCVRIQEPIKPDAVIVLPQMAQLMKNDIVDAFWGRSYQMGIQGDSSMW